MKVETSKRDLHLDRSELETKCRANVEPFKIGSYLALGLAGYHDQIQSDLDYSRILLYGDHQYFYEVFSLACIRCLLFIYVTSVPQSPSLRSEVAFLGSNVAFLLLYDTVEMEMGRKDSWMHRIFWGRSSLAVVLESDVVELVG
ncbi:unnamed protein product [Dovyalis caffra]|uniref:Uncharacterized protein n=1 Tax=Dovyalis caffra TaxID=77055 RepID=A0AAV1R5R1_9ROSI|nr:unnamed protein product [Dovyalis caffra]